MVKTTNLISVLLIVLVLTACSGGAPATGIATETPVDVNALQTAVVQTVVANITQTAAAITSTQAPTETLTPIPAAPTGTASPTPTLTPTLALSPTAALCDNSAFVSDASVLDNTQMTAGQIFIKSWKVKNTGSCSWSTGYQIIHAYGEKLGSLPTALSTEVLPGGEAEISINLKAPLKTGTYGGYFRLANNNGIPFGTVLTVIIVIP